MGFLTLSVLDRGVRIVSDDAAVLELLTAAYGAMASEPPEVHLEYRVGQRADRRLFFSRNGSDPAEAEDEGDFLWQFDGDLAVELQNLRRDLYFVHSAALGFHEKACLLVGGIGAGKSTLGWGLLHHGFDYSSDELAPIDLESLGVRPYPRALCLKHEPGSAFPATGAVRTSRALYLPAAGLPAVVEQGPRRVAATFLLAFDPEVSEPSLRRISAAEATARIYPNVLNALAHPADGLDGAIRIATGTECFALTSADLEATCLLVKATVEQLVS